jgi:hypothetical protein
VLSSSYPQQLAWMCGALPSTILSPSSEWHANAEPSVIVESVAWGRHANAGAAHEHLFNVEVVAWATAPAREPQCAFGCGQVAYLWTDILLRRTAKRKEGTSRVQVRQFCSCFGCVWRAVVATPFSPLLGGSCLEARSAIPGNLDAMHHLSGYWERTLVGRQLWTFSDLGRAWDRRPVLHTKVAPVCCGPTWRFFCTSGKAGC